MELSRDRILCTEDDPDTREMLTLILRHGGFDVFCAESSQDALDLATTEAFDLLLIDSWTPGLSGTELSKALRESNVSTPILFYSGAAYERDKENARLAGAQGYMVKPADSDELVSEIARLIAESKTSPQVQAATA
jgi:DNA-binding response OmpR family regulator